MAGSRQRVWRRDVYAASYFIAGIHVNSFAIAMEQPAIFDVVGR